MKRIWVIVCLCVALGTTARGPGEGNVTEILVVNAPTVQLTEAEQAWLRANPIVDWGAAPDWPPFSSVDREGRLVGIDADITRRVAERVGLKLNSVPGTWPEVYEKAAAGEVDFLSGTAKTSERLAMFDFTDAYGTFPVVIIARDEEDFYTPVTDLAFMTVAVVRDDVTTWQLQQDFPMGHFVFAETVEEAMLLVARGKVDVTVSNLAVATRAIRLRGLTNLKICGVTRYEFPLHFAVPKGNPELVSILNKGLATLTSAELERIYAAHLTPDIAKARDWGAWRRRALYSALIGGSVIGLVTLWNCWLARQIRQRKEVEAALRVARDRLERRSRELDNRIAEVEQLNRELQAVNQDLESFTGSVSHDLRAPARRIAAYAELLQMELGPALKETGKKMMSSILKESTRMNQLIHDLLEFARIGRAELRKRVVNMRQLVQTVIDDTSAQLHDRRVTWNIGELDEVYGDPNLLRYALTNLIDNALKYSQRNAETHIKVDMLQEPSAKGEHIFLVQDNGCGFDMDRAKYIFDPFQRLHSTDEYEGTGIGLANVHKVIHRHGGRIWCESEPGKGATFYFSLPGTAGLTRWSIHSPSSPQSRVELDNSRQ